MMSLDHVHLRINGECEKRRIKMEIQKILFPQVGRCTDREMYFRLEKSGFGSNQMLFYDNEKQTILFRTGEKVWFDTYFNGFSIEKWKKYTILDNLTLKLELSGKFKVILLNKEKVHNEVFEKIICAATIETDTRKTCEFSFADGNARGMYTFGLEALSDDSIFYGGAYCSSVPKQALRDIKIGIGICTFRREEFVKKNLKILKESILENKASPLYRHMEVFIADNGRTLESGELLTPEIHIYPNRNVGGAGGFTRDLIEIMENNNTFRITHVLLMDDDIVIEPEALVKTYTLLTLLKDTYIDAFIGGAMLRLDRQYIQVESGAVWDAGYLDPLKMNLDLRQCEACLYNETEEFSEYNAWWYCCFPVEIVTPDNLPLPIFIRGDDLEYGLRNMKHLILMNGICVWHEPFENKYSSYLEYYIIRNLLIDNAFHYPEYGVKQLNRMLFKHCIQEIMFYRYKNVDLYFQGIKDFLKGPEWLMQQDGETLHQQVMAAGYKGESLDKLDMRFNYPEYCKSFTMQHTTESKIKRNLTFNGLFLKAKGEGIVQMAAPKTVQFYRKKRVMHYDAAGKKAFITERERWTSVKYVLRTIGMMLTVCVQLKGVQKKYRTEGMQLRTLAFWREYLGL